MLAGGSKRILPSPTPDHLVGTSLDIRGNGELEVVGVLLHELVRRATRRGLVAVVGNGTLLERSLGTRDPVGLVEVLVVLEGSILLAGPVDTDETGVAVLGVGPGSVGGGVTVTPMAHEELLAGDGGRSRESTLAVVTTLAGLAGKTGILVAGVLVLVEAVGVLLGLGHPVERGDESRILNTGAVDTLSAGTDVLGETMALLSPKNYMVRIAIVGGSDDKHT